MEEFIVSGTIWSSFVCWSLVSIADSQLSIRSTRMNFVWTGGCLLLWAHIAAAYGVYHKWSHTASVGHIQGQLVDWRLDWMDPTAALFINWIFAVAWSVDLYRSWRQTTAGVDSSGRLAVKKWNRFFPVFAWLMWFNGAVVFANSPLRWPALVMLLAIPIAHSLRS